MMAEKTYLDLLDTLIAVIRQNGSLKTAPVEAAFRGVPRHLFVPDLPLEQVYADEALMVKRNEEGRWTSSSSQPSIMAIMLEQLDLRPGQRVLEIGAGTGYNAALMAAIVGPQGSVVTIDIQPNLIEAARRALDAAGYSRVLALVGDGGYGYPAGAPYDRIILTVGSYTIAPAWREQLVEGGILVLPLEVAGMQKSAALQRRGEELVSLSLTDCGFMPLQGDFAVPQKVKTPLSDDPRLCLEARSERLEDARHIAGWLQDPPLDLPGGVTAKLGAYIYSLAPWIELHLAQVNPLVELTARQELADQNLIPPYIGIGGDWKSMNTLLLIEPDGAAAFTRPPGQPVQWFLPGLTAEGHENPVEQEFELHVRQLGPDDGPAQRLLAYIRAWDAAGRPGANQMSLRVVPQGAPVRPEAGEFVLERPWIRLLVKYK